MNVMAQLWRIAFTGTGMLVLAACGPQTPEEVRGAAIAKCEQRFARSAPDPSKGTALCTCLTDKLAEEGMEITDILSGERAKVEEIGRNCAKSEGMTLPGF